MTVQEKVERIHDLASDDTVAAAVSTDFLRRPEVAARAVAEPTVRHIVNRAQLDRSRQAGEVLRQRTPAVARIEHTSQFLDLVGACTAFVASAGWTVPAMRGHRFTDDERATVHRNIARIRSAGDWVEAAVDTGNVSLDEGLARLLRGK